MTVLSENEVMEIIDNDFSCNRKDKYGNLQSNVLLVDFGDENSKTLSLTVTKDNYGDEENDSRYEIVYEEHSAYGRRTLDQEIIKCDENELRKSVRKYVSIDTYKELLAS